MHCPTLAALILVLLPLTSFADAQSDSHRPTKETALIRLFTAPDESSPQSEALQPDEILYPVAESIGSEGSTWYLVKTQGGLIGWIKGGNSEGAKRAADLFRSLPSRHVTSPPVEIPLQASDTASSAIVSVPILMNGSAAFATVTLNGTVQALMLLDTGATYTIVSRQVATTLRLNETTRVTISTANGSINVPLSSLGSMKVGAAEVTNVTVAIHDIFANSTLGGVLGLDFLGRFHTSIDSRRKLLILAPR